MIFHRIITVALILYLKYITEYCGVPKGKKSCAGTSTCTPSSATASSTCTTASTPESDSDSFAGQLMEMDDCLLIFFQGKDVK